MAKGNVAISIMLVGMLVIAQGMSSVIKSLASCNFILMCSTRSKVSPLHPLLLAVIYQALDRWRHYARGL